MSRKTRQTLNDGPRPAIHGVYLICGLWAAFNLIVCLTYFFWNALVVSPALADSPDLSLIVAATTFLLFLQAQIALIRLDLVHRKHVSDERRRQVKRHWQQIRRRMPTATGIGIFLIVLCVVLFGLFAYPSFPGGVSDTSHRFHYRGRLLVPAIGMAFNYFAIYVNLLVAGNCRNLVAEWKREKRV